ncbi:MAG: cyclic nucleotide-binding domain-containing protein [Lachnospiraceae bacterium]|nr:cyclic nucleotide-binding domain-containing protein [Lachnospiraceae bacterium]
MGLVSIEAGTKIFNTGDTADRLILIMKGSVRVSFVGGSYILKNGDFIGIADLGHRHTVMTYEAIEKCQVVEYPFSFGQLSSFLTSNKDTHKFFLSSLFRQLGEISGLYRLLKNEYESIKTYLASSYEDYIFMCEKLSTSPGELASYDDVINFDFEEILPEWMTGYYSVLEEIVTGAGTNASDPDFLTGLLLKSSNDITSMVTACSEVETNKTDLMALLVNENGVDLLELFLSLYIKGAKKVGIDDPTMGRIIRTINDIMMQAETQGIDQEEFYEQRKDDYERILIEAKEISLKRDKNVESHGEEQFANVSESLNVIIEYANPSEELAKSFYENISLYKNTVNKNGSEDNIRKLRTQIAKEFNEIYQLAFLRSALETEVPTILKMFFNFGYVDEELIGVDNAVYLYNLVEKLPTDPTIGVYSYYEWLMSIYECKKDPGRNEFDTDYAEYLHEQMRNNKISKKEEAALFNDSESRVKYELDNIFGSVNKTTTGRITTFCPLLSEHNLIKGLEEMLVTADKVRESVVKIRSIDYGAYYRQTMYAAPENGISKEIIDVEILPDFILTPNIGNRGIMWQEIEGKRRTTPARMFLSIFQQEDLYNQILKLTGQFRWEMCKRVQGARWNDITEHSLTSEYFDYVQFYRKNNELSAEAKDKIKNDLVRSKNSFREMFIRDYIVWINFESQGSPRLNKVVRAIMFSYVPFSRDVRKKLGLNPMYKDMVERYEVKQGAKIHRMDNLIKKISNMGKEVPDEIEMQMHFLEG